MSRVVPNDRHRASPHAWETQREGANTDGRRAARLAAREGQERRAPLDHAPRCACLYRRGPQGPDRKRRAHGAKGEADMVQAADHIKPAEDRIDRLEKGEEVGVARLMAILGWK